MLPPPSLSKEDIRAMADVRREIWTNGAYGLGIGSASGGTLHALASWGNRRGWWKVATGRNTLMASVILGGTVGSFLLATATGKNSVHNLHPIYGRGGGGGGESGGGLDGGGAAVQRSSSGGRSSDSDSYQESLQRAKRRETDLRTLERSRTLSNRAVSLPISEELDDASVERVQRERNRLFRRASLSQQLEGHGGGLSDSHGGRWVK
jgi:hypothetical protein